jgi:hypothetical protein
MKNYNELTEYINTLGLDNFDSLLKELDKISILQTEKKYNKIINNLYSLTNNPYFKQTKRINVYKKTKPSPKKK